MAVISIHIYCESTFIHWHQFSWFLQNASILLILEFVVSNTTGDNQWENCITLDFNFRGLQEPSNPQKLKLHDK
jgi:hypothetical protein